MKNHSELKQSTIVSVAALSFSLVVSTILSVTYRFFEWPVIIIGTLAVVCMFLGCAWVITHGIESGLERKISDLSARIEEFTASQGSNQYSWLITTDKLRKIEAKIKVENIWIITDSLQEELDKEDFGDIIRKNLERGKVYTYFIPDDEGLKTRVNRMRDTYKSGNMYFKMIDSKLFKIISAQDMAIFGATGPGSAQMAGYMNLPLKERGNNFFIGMSAKHCELVVGTLRHTNSTDL